MFVEGMTFKQKMEFLEKVFEEEKSEEDLIVEEEKERVLPKDSLWLMSEP